VRYLKSPFSFLAASLSLLLVCAAAAGASAPQDVVGVFNQSLISLLGSEKSFEDRSGTIEPAVRKTFDLEFMASKVLGRGWKDLSPDQQRQWTEAFTRMTVSNYAGRFVGEPGPSFETLGEEEGARGTRMVLTKLVQPSDDDVELNYRLRETDAGWRVIDCYMNGTVSEVALRRSEYGAVLRRDGFDALLAAINTKSDELASSPAP
jgi:phospholipid transport system substrate-binding protein